MSTTLQTLPNNQQEMLRLCALIEDKAKAEARRRNGASDWYGDGNTPESVAPAEMALVKLVRATMTNTLFQYEACEKHRHLPITLRVTCVPPINVVCPHCLEGKP